LEKQQRRSRSTTDRRAKSKA